jgi:hypothetical protein
MFRRGYIELSVCEYIERGVWLVILVRYRFISDMCEIQNRIILKIEILDNYSIFTGEPNPRAQAIYVFVHIDAMLQGVAGNTPLKLVKAGQRDIFGYYIIC